MSETAFRGALRATAITLLCGLVLLIGANPAFAHARLIGSDPAEDAVLDAAPERVSLEFNESPRAEFSAVTVVGPDGTEYQEGEILVEGNTLSVDVTPLGEADDYEIGYRVISVDGHPITGSVGFTLTTAAATTAPAGEPTQPAVEPAAAAPAIPVDEGGMPVWPWIVGAVLVVGGGVGAALRIGRQ